MVFELHHPVYPLNQFIDSFIYYRDFHPNHSLDRFLPDGNVNIIFELTGDPKYIYHNETLQEIQSCRRVWFSGMRNKFITIPSGRDSEMFIINFHKGKSYPFINMPLYELTDSVVDGELVLTPEIIDMRDLLLEAKTIQQKFQAAEKFLIKKFEHKLILNPFVDFAVEKITSLPHIYSMEEISRKVGYSQKHVIKIFKDHVGVSPKNFLKLIRFQKSINDIARSKTIIWSQIAHEAGYYDQAHFINDFKSFSGFTPHQYLKRESEYLNYVALD